ncbi:MAG: threonine/serine exporter family protein [Turicibacter sp.]|nr:threonine/serine exporter family protein [Turicibacter sp.]
MNFNQLLNISTQLGKMLLENGAEIYRVEESIRRIGLAYGAKEVDVYAVPNTIIVTLMTTENINLTKTKRIHDRSTNLDKVERLNHLCRHICQTTPKLELVYEELKEIQNRPIYSFRVQLFAYALTSSMFTLFFGGTILDAFCSLLIGPLIKVVSYYLNKFHTNPFFVTILCSFMCAFLSTLFCRLRMGQHVDKMIIGLVMNLVPGVAITNSVRDIIAGDFIAGQTKMTEALLTATSIALGTGVALSITARI